MWHEQTVMLDLVKSVVLRGEMSDIFGIWNNFVYMIPLNEQWSFEII